MSPPSGDAVTASVVLVLSIGNFLGGFVKGMTGFGSAIIHLLVWSSCKYAGLDSGSLRQAVATECASNFVVAVPLLLMTKAHRTADVRLVVALTLFSAVGAPVGAHLLTHMNPRIVELALGCLLLVLICAQTQLHLKARLLVACGVARLRHGRGRSPKAAAGDPREAQEAADEDTPLQPGDSSAAAVASSSSASSSCSVTALLLLPPPAALTGSGDKDVLSSGRQPQLLPAQQSGNGDAADAAKCLWCTSDACGCILYDDVATVPQEAVVTVAAAAAAANGVDTARSAPGAAASSPTPAPVLGKACFQQQESTLLPCCVCSTDVVCGWHSMLPQQVRTQEKDSAAPLIPVLVVAEVVTAPAPAPAAATVTAVVEDEEDEQEEEVPLLLSTQRGCDYPCHADRVCVPNSEGAAVGGMESAIDSSTHVASTAQQLTASPPASTVAAPGTGVLDVDLEAGPAHSCCHCTCACTAGGATCQSCAARAVVAHPSSDTVECSALAGTGADAAVGGAGGPLAAPGAAAAPCAAYTKLSTVRLFSVMSLAAAFSGLMGAMTGVGGPPIMYMYHRLQVPKEVVRGTNAVCNVLQVRMVMYFVMGVFQRRELGMYGACSAAALAGVLAGCGLAPRVDQRAFGRILLCLMMLCCLLLFASAAGIK